MIEDFAFYRQVLILCHAGGSGVIQFLQFDNGVFDVAQQHICHVAAESLSDNDTHYYIIFQFGRQCIGGNHPTLLREFILQVIQCPFGGLCILRFQVPDEQRVHYFIGIIHERSHFSDFVVDILGDCERIVLYFFVSLKS